MIFQEVKWLRSCGDKICPVLRKAALDCHRSYRVIPCYLQRFIKYVKKRWIKIPVIVQFEAAGPSAANLHALAQSAGCRVKKELPLINSFTTKINTIKIQSLSTNSMIKKIWYDREVKTVLDIAASTVQTALPWGSSLAGEGITAAVLDTGIYNHPDLSGRIIGFKDFVKNKTEPYDDNGHGTHVAGDIAANGVSSNYLYIGPAYKTNLVGVKVLNKLGSGSLSTVIEGIQWCIDNKNTYGIRVINLSLGSSATESYENDPVCQAVEKAWNSGIVVCAAAGNSGPKANTVGSPGIDPLIITVGALDDRNTEASEDNQIADFSSRGPTIDGLVKPDVVAPGVNIISLRSPGSNIDKTNKETRVGTSYASLSGTSMATPVCAGVICQILQSKKSLTPDQLKEVLMATAVKLPGVDENSQGAGLISAEKAVSSAPEYASSIP